MSVLTDFLAVYIYTDPEDWLVWGDFCAHHNSPIYSRDQRDLRAPDMSYFASNSVVSCRMYLLFSTHSGLSPAVTGHCHVAMFRFGAFHCRKVIFPSESQATLYSRCPGLSRNKLPDSFHCSAAEPKEHDRIPTGTQFSLSGTSPPTCTQEFCEGHVSLYSQALLCTSLFGSGR